MVIVATVALAGCAQPASTPAATQSATPADAPAPGSLVAAHEAFVEALTTGDVDGVVSLLETDPPTLVFHPEVATRFEGPDQIREALKRMLAVTGPLGWTEVHGEVTQAGEAGWFTYHVLVEPEKMDEAVRARATEIWRYTDGAWHLAHVHWSEIPADAD
jgi:ketosteroid isomerase-like protein